MQCVTFQVIHITISLYIRLYNYLYFIKYGVAWQVGEDAEYSKCTHVGVRDCSLILYNC